jgi:ABC-type dipeptide/oligopeptide/nickel transport system permease subunit
MNGGYNKLKEKSQLFHRLKRSKFFVIGLTVCTTIIVLSIISPFISVHNPEIPDLANNLKPPEYFSKGWSGNVLGTDSLGRDVLTRLLIGSRFSFIIAFGAVFLSILIGIIAGLYSGYYGGWIDNLIMRFADIQLSIPSLILAIAIVSVLGPSVINLILVLTITAWPQIARVIRGNVLIVREMELIKASRVLGAGDAWIMFSQILPNVITPLLILASQQIGFMILVEASLSFLGLGIQPPEPSWGVMIADGREYLTVAPWVVMAPGIALMIAVLAFNFLGDGLRDALDPKMKT